MDREFSFLNLRMANWTVIYGLGLVGWGTHFSLATGSQSITSWIPAMRGAPILLMGLMCLARPAHRKIWMHVAVLFGLLAFLGGLDFFRAIVAGAEPFANPAAGASKLMLFVSGGLFVFICVRSFIWARSESTSA